MAGGTGARTAFLAPSVTADARARSTAQRFALAAEFRAEPVSAEPPVSGEAGAERRRERERLGLCLGSKWVRASIILNNSICTTMAQGQKARVRSSRRESFELLNGAPILQERAARNVEHSSPPGERARAYRECSFRTLGDALREPGSGMRAPL